LLGFLEFILAAFYSLSFIAFILLRLFAPDPLPPPKAGTCPELSLLKLKFKVSPPPVCSRSS